MSRYKFAEQLSESFVSVWVDDVSGFGTFPIESMKCGVPVIGKVPNMVPEWMNDRNGMWTNNINNIVDILGNYVQAWLEDLEPKEMYDEMDTTHVNYTEKNQKNLIEEYFDSLVKKYVTNLKAEQLEIENNITKIKNETTNG